MGLLSVLEALKCLGPEVPVLGLIIFDLALEMYKNSFYVREVKILLI